jgi:hypothetical protein
MITLQVLVRLRQGGEIQSLLQPLAIAERGKVHPRDAITSLKYCTSIAMSAER